MPLLLAQALPPLPKSGKIFQRFSRKEFKFEGALPKEESGYPITRYLINEDSVDLFLQIYYISSNNKKEDLIACDTPLLAGFFAMQIMICTPPCPLIAGLNTSGACVGISE